MGHQERHAVALALAGASWAVLAQSPPIEFKGIPMGASVAQVQSTLPGVECRDTYCSSSPSKDASKTCKTEKGADGRDLPPNLRGLGVGMPDRDCYRRMLDALTFGNTIPSRYSITLLNGRVSKVYITFPQLSFNGMVAGLTEKYGIPTKDVVEQSQNRMGATFADRQVTWQRADGYIFATERAGTIDESSVTMASAEAMAEFERAQKQQGRDVAKRL